MTDETASSVTSSAGCGGVGNSYPSCSRTQTNKQTNVFFIRINGCKTYGPPANWTGEPPPVHCEIFIKGIPNAMCEYDLLEIFQKWGRVFEFRLMVDFANDNRGFGFVRYACEEDTLRALEILNLVFVQPYKMLSVCRSLNKCQLFVGNIPSNVDNHAIELWLRKIFPQMLSLTLPHLSWDCRNRNIRNNFVFVNFADHNAAVRAKQYTSSGRFRFLDNDLKIAWANADSRTFPDNASLIHSFFFISVCLLIKSLHISE